jgi:hypothetical protein
MRWFKYLCRCGYSWMSGFSESPIIEFGFYAFREPCPECGRVCKPKEEVE